MDLKEVIVQIVIPAIAAGILVPVIIRRVLKWQKQRGVKLLEDNGKMDLIDEISEKVRKEQ